ncbi:MAG: tetratricopeptide repeat protein [Candidatus Wallbacteria bacterium]|nr:tetratricopeptide repeat protein [Candidatus Wallbacteria bacterium]
MKRGIVLIAFLFCTSLFAENVAETTVKAKEYLDKGNLENAITLYKLALKSGPTASEEIELDKALADCYEDLTRKSPEYCFYYWDTYLSKLKKDDLGEALNDLYARWGEEKPVQVLELFDKYLPLAREGDLSYDEFLYKLAELNVRLKKPEEAERLWQEIVKYYSNSDLKKQVLKHLYESAVNRKDYPEAISYLEKLPQTAVNLIQLGDIYYGDQDYYQAIGFYQKALAEGPDDETQTTVLRKLYEIAIKLGNFDRALTLLADLSKSSPDDKSEFALNEARIWFRGKNSFIPSKDNTYLNTYENYRKAEKLYLNVKDSAKEHPELARKACLELADLYLATFDNKRAREQLDFILKEWKESAEAEIAAEMLKTLKE